ncbi:hypothetical protein GCM10008098_17320 [Rhodanobacter panaciterrae]|uniref:Uncharacterized protein n=1 Tax=Rhodanobacter panaciterrae TaxID=490572 RepID=A0ABQ2ZTW8_9GAMM|nr:hypothetical protein GCM10008098_17320 [Rhodanobacter panaciterrae]
MPVRSPPQASAALGICGAAALAAANGMSGSIAVLALAGASAVLDGMPAALVATASCAIAVNGQTATDKVMAHRYPHLRTTGRMLATPPGNPRRVHATGACSIGQRSCQPRTGTYRQLMPKPAHDTSHSAAARELRRA